MYLNDMNLSLYLNVRHFAIREHKASISTVKVFTSFAFSIDGGVIGGGGYKSNEK